MKTRIDDQIEQLERIVEARLDPCMTMRNGSRCTLPANHTGEAHKFASDFSGNGLVRERISLRWEARRPASSR